MENKPSTPAEFDTFAEDYDAALQSGLSATGEDKNYFALGRVQWLVQRLAQHKVVPRTIMDFGCGTGTATPILLEAFPGASVTGVDVSARSLDVARATYAGLPARFVLLEDFRPGADFDLVFSNGTFHHIPPPERPAVIQTIKAALRRDGRFALFENNPWNPGTRYIMSRIPFDRDASTLSPLLTHSLLTKGGFQRPDVDFLFFFPNFLSTMRPLEVHLRKLPLGGQYLALTQPG